MFEIKKEIQLQLIEKKSKFTTRFFKISSEEMARDIISKIRKQEQRANHNCYAWRLLKENGQIYIKRNDDGEVSGTAGAPMLACLIGENLVNVLVITTRYFGGIKLGTGPLTRMYKKGVTEGLKEAEIVPLIIRKKITVKTSIKKSNQLLYLINKKEYSILGKQFTDKVILELELSDNELEDLKKELTKMQIQIKIMEG